MIFFVYTIQIECVREENICGGINPCQNNAMCVQNKQLNTDTKIKIKTLEHLYKCDCVIG